MVTVRVFCRGWLPGLEVERFGMGPVPKDPRGHVGEEYPQHTLQRAGELHGSLPTHVGYICRTPPGATRHAAWEERRECTALRDQLRQDGLAGSTDGRGGGSFSIRHHRASAGEQINYRLLEGEA